MSYLRIEWSFLCKNLSPIAGVDPEIFQRGAEEKNFEDK